MAQINIKVDDQLKDDVSKIFAEMGLDLTSGIKIYLKRVQQDKKIPFELTSTPTSAADNSTTAAGLNKLLSALAGAKGADDSSIGGSVLKATSHEQDDQPGGIGQGILNNHR
ncbi:type II toxin-antitoxin system RelB/DinJ family antitoxin [Limosilactobacillus sp.]|uniref:type II toxin-antitoxin system RelB/DinJ family antitoxin n=1 Tax=Limosilactobacillus sp. TaxID=2773925 RepID=UPI0025C46E0E|nr:type II toxin-antitoxin system RelB/DinJ family antitoxin [Limosilactobacillus sp.]MCH3921687.1 type II toxin-antitoxin system RelB/DinJ family antitoxin [Limosilactobacillus sp.]MCH3928458.1 type II toxin-antitoxin system RelB/DinJ family antitoxin [Limosilactobacillus sp.]